MTSLSLGSKGSIETRDSQNRLIYHSSEGGSKFKQWFDTIRGRWCFSHRGKWAVRGFREGDINLFTLLFLAVVLITGGTKWE